MMLFFTAITRSADAILSEQNANTDAKRDDLDQIKALAYRARDAVVAGRFDEIGEILRENWEIKKALAAQLPGGSGEAFSIRLASPQSGGRCAW